MSISKQCLWKSQGKRQKIQAERQIERKSHEFVQIVLDVAGGGLPLYKQMKTRNRFEWLKMAQIMASFP